MTTADFAALLPLLVISGSIVALLLVFAFLRSHRLAFLLTLAALAGAFGTVAADFSHPAWQATALLLMDSFARYTMGLILAAAFAISLMAHAYFERRRAETPEFYLLLLLASLGAMILAAASHFVSFFLGLEILSISLYSLNAFLPGRMLGVEAAIKYLVLAAASAAFLLFGMALVYNGLGTMEFSGVIARLNASGGFAAAPALPAGLVLMLAAIGFKLALVPFHFWAPDVYEGAPAPAAAVIASISKAGVFALLLRLLYAAARLPLHAVFVVLAAMAVASIALGNLLALRQQRVKRILACSSIAHMGYLLIAFLAGGPLGLEAAIFYLTAYVATTIGAFGVVAMASLPERDSDLLDDFRGLFWRRPLLAAIFTVMLLSLAGIPLTAGFLGKFYTVMAGAATAHWGLLLVLVAGSATGLVYYLRVVLALYTRPSVDAARPVVFLLPALPVSGAIALVGVSLVLFWLGVFPALFLGSIRHAVASLL